jgi:hypothetical protein
VRNIGGLSREFGKWHWARADELSSIHLSFSLSLSLTLEARSWWWGHALCVQVQARWTDQNR